MEQNQVSIALDLALEEIENAITVLNRAGGEAFTTGNYELARDLIEKGSHMTSFRQKVKELQKEWSTIYSGKIKDQQKEWVNVFGGVVPIRQQKRTKIIQKKAKKGLRTPEDAFRLPVLQALVDLGGSGSITAVLDIVGKKLLNKLNDVDCQSLPSDPDAIRWRNTAQWARKALVDEGLMSSKSPRGIWEITDEGRKVVGK